MLSWWVQGAPRCSSPLRTWGQGLCGRAVPGSTALNGPVPGRPGLVSALPGVALAGLWSRGTEPGLVQVTYWQLSSHPRGEKVSGSSPSSWESHMLTGCSVTGLERPSPMENMARLCQQFGIPLWVAPVLEQAATMKCDKSRRHKAYRLIRRRLWEGRIGLEKTKYPTYIYPKELKNLMRSAFPAGVCDYPDPDHSKVVHVTLEDLHLLDHPEAGSAQPCLQ